MKLVNGVHAVQDAFLKGRTAKIKKREEMAAGVGANMCAVQGKEDGGISRGMG